MRAFCLGLALSCCVPANEAAIAPEPSRAEEALTQVPCSVAKLAELRAPATASAREAVVDCNVTLEPSDVITKRLIFRGAASSGVTLECAGATLDGGVGRINEGRDMIEIVSRKDAQLWEPPTDIIVRDCRIIGALRIWGMGKNGEATDVRDSSRKPDHVARVRANAPSRITLERLYITGLGRTPLYLAPGVHDVSFTDSEIDGEATSVGIYLDAESTRNVIRNNYLHVTSRQEYVGGVYTRKREEIAVDGSSYNQIVNNYLATLEGGGIYLYRNCGEGGTVRHSPPSHNTIVNNIFYYNSYGGDNPAIYLGSRDNDFWEGRWYCGADSGYAWGSSSDNRSFAHNNVVMQNQIYKRSLSDMIQYGDKSNAPNFVAHNEQVSAHVDRRAGCYVPTAFKPFLLDGERVDVFSSASGEPACDGTETVCDDGVSKSVPATGCAVTRHERGCQVTGNNAGCSSIAACPAGQLIVGVAAACNLESGSVTDAELAAAPVGDVSVVMPSSKPADGRCFVGSSSLRKGQIPIVGAVGQTQTIVGCKEHDKNGGDCQVRVALYCR